MSSPTSDGAWPYLELIEACAERDPLDPEVVEAYWLGSPLLERTDLLLLGNSIEDRFRRRAGIKWDAVSHGLSSVPDPTTPSTSSASIHGSGCSSREWSIRHCMFSTGAGSAGASWKDQRTPRSWCDHVHCIGTAGRSAWAPRAWRRSRQRSMGLRSNRRIWSRCTGTTCVRESRMGSSRNSSTITSCISESSTQVHRGWNRASEAREMIAAVVLAASRRPERADGRLCRRHRGQGGDCSARAAAPVLAEFRGPGPCTCVDGPLRVRTL